MSPKDWNIRPRAKACHKSGKPFEEDQVFISRLVEADDGYERQDIAQVAWTDDLKEGALSIWQSVFKAPPPPSEEPLKPETVEDTLRVLMQKNDPDDVGAVFILAMQLERKRQLLPRDRKRRADGMLILVYEHKQTGETFIVPDPEWKLDELIEVQRSVAQRLGWIEPDPDESEGDEEQVAEDGAQAAEGEASAENDEADEEPSESGETLTEASHAG